MRLVQTPIHLNNKKCVFRTCTEDNPRQEDEGEGEVRTEEDEQVKDRRQQKLAKSLLRMPGAMGLVNFLLSGESRQSGNRF